MFNDRPFYSFPHSGINKKSPFELRNGADATMSDFPVSNLKIASNVQPVNLQTGLTYGNRYFHKRLGMVMSLSYQNLYRGTDQTLITQYPGAKIIPNAYNNGTIINNYPVFDQVYGNTISVQQKRIGLNNKFDYTINSKNKISLYNLFVHMDEFQTREQTDTDVNANLGKYSVNMRTMWRIQSIYNGTLQGEHQLSAGTTLNWTGTYSYATQQIPDMAQFGYAGSVEPNGSALRYLAADSGIANSMSRTWTHNNDQDVAGYLNLIVKRNIAHRNVEMSFGTMFREKTRTNFYRGYSLSASNSLPQIITNVDSISYQFKTSASDPASGDSGIARNYSITEDVAAAYWQFKFMATPKLQVIGGVRFENTDQHYTTNLTQNVNAKYGHIYYYDFLPSLHLKYAINVRQNIRASYFRSFVRPSFAEIVPAFIPASQTEGYDQQGNPGVKHTTADNYDIRYELYPKKGADQLLIGAFLKQIYNPIEQTFDHYSVLKASTSPGAFYLTPQNIGTVTNAGLEILVTKYIGKFGISANYTYTHSATTTGKNYEEQLANGTDTTPNRNQTRPLQGQAASIGNISLLFKDHKLGLDMQLSYVYTGERIQLVNTYYNLDTWQSPFGQLDFSFTKRIIKKLEVYGKIMNLTNEHTSFFIKTPYYNSAKNTNALPFQDNPTKHIFVEKDIFKTSYLFGVRYKL
jgi:TonB-dependent receptor